MFCSYAAKMQERNEQLIMQVEFSKARFDYQKYPNLPSELEPNIDVCDNLARGSRISKKINAYAEYNKGLILYLEALLVNMNNIVAKGHYNALLKKAIEAFANSEQNSSDYALEKVRVFKAFALVRLDPANIEQAISLIDKNINFSNEIAR